MTVQESLQKIRTPWVERISRELASGEGVRVGFIEQLERFYELLEHTVVTGNLAWLDPVLYDWGQSPTETNLEQGDYYVSFIVNRMTTLTIEVARENLGKEDALELVAAVVPIFTHSLSVVVRYEMETRVAHISSELNKTQEKLQQLDHNKSNFISVAAHELKTPLTLIEGYTTMMVDMVEQSGQSPIDSLLKGVNTGIQRLRQIIDDMIDVSLIDNNLLALNFQPLWVSHMLNLLKNELKKTVTDRKQTLIVNQFEGSDLMIYGDSERLYQALYNVASNAIKYTPDHGTITIEGRLLPGFIEITIKDTGIGISPENQSRIFEKFGQLGRTDLHSSGKTKFKGGGPGLGLPITRGIIEAHGGTIWVESEGYDEEKLKGSTFHILLPTRTEATDPLITKFFGAPGQLKSESEKETIGKETPPTNNPTS
ncbi:MAG TPA: HAMP domain-containing sensor histidine kinase [Anaerolineales bacterium]|nr:HAMP domain-containing sensor histidine kinase [Anaerolineales bacterium]HMV96483.1 HAMP domain-containing sensor histidine kinase [Anaerolineales bacterium]HMX20364.1 HAMP domain-containing sensor histidine kinase [Anaerolineales bacterium]HMZ44035.1 HAMP domain-containing sensor histidine kinase [Anaerolineales bacterium]HNA55287.1 HAMP domain-containing sensor histidine kinase [Anaerolineales bacterium]